MGSYSKIKGHRSHKRSSNEHKEKADINRNMSCNHTGRIISKRHEKNENRER